MRVGRTLPQNCPTPVVTPMATPMPTPMATPMPTTMASPMLTPMISTNQPATPSVPADSVYITSVSAGPSLVSPPVTGASSPASSSTVTSPSSATAVGPSFRITTFVSVLLSVDPGVFDVQQFVADIVDILGLEPVRLILTQRLWSLR